MKKETLADKMAKKSFYSEAIQQSWNVHMQVFKPILEPAFKEDYQSKIHLTAALNFISRKDVKKGFDKLRKLEKACKNDADMAAWLFFMGVCFEMADMKEEMLSFYQEANEFEHGFYLPYMKVAKNAYEDCAYEACEYNYRRAIECLEGNLLAPQYRTYLGASFCNLSSCLIMMHRYEEAEEFLEESKRILPVHRGREATEVVLQAIKGNRQAVEELLDYIEKEIPEISELTINGVEKIYAEMNPQFFVIEIDREAINAFWLWFAKEQDSLVRYIKKEKYDVFFCEMQAQLEKVFPFVENSLELAVEPKEDYYEITFADFYMKALENGYNVVIEACPEEIKKKWKFEVVH